MRIRRCLRELHDHPKLALSLKTRMIKGEAIDALLYGCNRWTLCHESLPGFVLYQTRNSVFITIRIGDNQGGEMRRSDRKEENGVKGRKKEC